MLLAVLLLAAPASAAPKKAAAPAVPETARRAFVRGNTAFADAKAPADFAVAALRYEEATKLAPKWPEPWFNLAKAREAAQDYPAALAALKSYLALPLSAVDKRQAQDLSYALEEKGEKKSRAAAAAAAIDAFLGTWSRTIYNSRGDSARQSFTLAQDGAGLRVAASEPATPRPPHDPVVRGGTLSLKLPYTFQQSDGRVLVTATAVYTGRLSLDGKTLTFSAPEYEPYTPEQERHWREWTHGPGDAYGGPAWSKQ